MTAVIIPFPKRPPQIVTEDDAVDCRNCVHARFGVLTHCTLVGESIVDESQAASECDAFEKEPE